MGKRIPKYTVEDYRKFLSDSEDSKQVAAALVLAMAAWKQKDLNDVSFAAVLDMCSNHVKKHI